MPQVQANGRLVLSLRPEKIELLGAGAGRLQGRVTARFFLGSQWLYRIATDLGELSVIRPNNGTAPLEVDHLVGLDWSPQMLRVLETDEVVA